MFATTLAHRSEIKLKYKQMTKNSKSYTAEDLVEIAADARLEVSALQVGEWHRAGLLPDPVKAPEPKKRGRPRLLFPEPTPNVVCSLARWRRWVTGNENARGWLWLEGYDHLDLDPDKELATWLEREWTEYRKTCPSLPESPETPIDPERREQILEELDENYTKLESKKHGVPVEWFAVHPALLGLFSEEEWRQLEEQGFGEDNDTPSKSLLAGVYEGGQYVYGEVPYSRDEMLTGLAGNPGWLAAMGLPGLRRGPIDWASVRAIWQFACVMTNIYDSAPELLEQVHAASELAEHPDSRECRPLMRWLRKFRYHAYSHYEPWFMAAVVANICKVIPERLRRELIQAAREFRRKQDAALAQE